MRQHLKRAHELWRARIGPTDSVIDATCGNGHDTLFLAQLGPAKLYALDIQQAAINASQLRLGQLQSQVHWFHQCHSSFPNEVLPGTMRLIVYNLGYLPGNDKSLTTRVETTLLSLQKALVLLKPGGLLCVTCYPGHTEGAREEEQILLWASKLDPLHWQVCHERWINRSLSPSLLTIELKIN